MGYNYVTSRGAKALENTTSVIGAIVLILIIAAIVVGICALTFWLFIWAVATLFGYHIAFTFINWVAYVILAWIFGRGASSSSSDKK